MCWNFGKADGDYKQEDKFRLIPAQERNKMNTCVSDDENIINIQGIRYVSWGEMSESNYRFPNRKWTVMVTYKGNHQTFYYTHRSAAYGMFNKIREAMDKSLRVREDEKTNQNDMEKT